MIDLPARLAALAGDAWSAEARMAVAVSGGADSLALLALCAGAFGAARVMALTVDHGVRPESAAEAEHVARLCATAGVAHATLRPAAPLAAAGLQAAARVARYALLGDWCRARGVALLLTAHHADDQAETLLLRLDRGAGLAGLAGIRAVRDLDGVRLLRPLLDVPRATLRAALPADWAAVDDPSNRDPRFARTRARAALVGGWPRAAGMAASAAHLAQAEAALDWAADRAFAGGVERAGDALLIDADGLPAELRRRLLLRCFAALDAPAPRGPDLARLLARLAAGGQGTLAGVRVAARPDGRWRMRGVAPPRPARDSRFQEDAP